MAGRFYPADPRQLADIVDALLDAVPVPDGDVLAPAYVVPHAGYQYSGSTAAHVYARLRRHADEIAQVVLLGPSHHVPMAGCAVPAVAGWATPLGQAPLDLVAIERLIRDGHAALDDGPHAVEHALEVQLPFLQRALTSPDGPGVPTVPIAVGDTAADDVAGTLAAAWSPGTVVLCSTDLSHYLDLATTLARDARTVRAVLELAPERIGPRDACGVFALRGVVTWADRAGLRPLPLHQATSAEVSGDPSRVVGYAAISFGRPEVAGVAGSTG